MGDGEGAAQRGEDRQKLFGQPATSEEVEMPAEFGAARIDALDPRPHRLREAGRRRETLIRAPRTPRPSIPARSASGAFSSRSPTPRQRAIPTSRERQPFDQRQLRRIVPRMPAGWNIRVTTFDSEGQPRIVRNFLAYESDKERAIELVRKRVPVNEGELAEAVAEVAGNEFVGPGMRPGDVRRHSKKADPDEG